MLENPVRGINIKDLKEVIPCCSPPILIFARKDDAEKFKKGFSGEIRSFDEIISHMKF